MLFNGGNSVVEQLSTIGGFGQLLYSQQREGPNSASYDSTQLFYDAFVRPYQATMPCVTTVGQGCPSAAKTTTTFDALGRPTKTTDGGTTPGYVSSAYTQNDVLQSVGPAPSGENLKQKQLEYDAVGRLISVCEITNLTGSGVCGQNSSQPNGYWTKYAYGVNASGNPTVTVTQNAQASTGQQTRVYTYDLLGRLIAEQNPENATTTYTYDSVAGSYCANTGAYSSPGDLVAKADANGNHTCYYYDVLHRVTDVGNNNQSATNSCKRFRYDNSLGVLGAKPSGITVNNGLGRMVEAETDTCASPITQSSIITDEWFSYSARGELTDTYESTLHSGGYYHVTQGYWANGAMSSLSSNITGLPNQTYGVDSMGRTSTVSASTGQKPVTSTTYNLSAFTYGVTFGSGDSDTFNLDPKTGRMTKYTFTVASNSDIGQTNWNPDGSLASLNITDTVPGTTDTQNCNFAHDDLARISSVNCANGATNKWNQNFAYDAFGNISKTVPTGGTGITFPGSLPAQAYSSSTNWLTTISGCTPTYDSDGQLTYDCVHHYTWNAASKMVSVDSTTTLTYDAQGRMVEKAIGSTFTQVVYGPYGRCALMSGQTLVKAFIPLPTGAQAVYTPSGLAYYRHHDHLGSSRLATTPSRTLYSSTAYAPFGEPYAQAGATDLSFTGQDQDTVSGIHDFLFRKYVPVQGRWLSPDPAGLDAVNPASPQSWNRYGYVMNNPVSFIDPLGLGPCSKEGESSGHCSGGGEPGCIWDDSTATLTCLISPEPGDPCIGCGDSNPGQEGQNGGGGSDGNSQLDRAIINALKLLQNTKCADLIDRGTGIATALLTQAQNGQAPVGTIGESISVGTTPSGLSAVTQPTGFGTSSITISPTGDFFNSNSSGFQDLTRAGYQSLVILHEIGHAVGYFMGNNPMYPSRGGYNTSATGIQPDKGNSYLGGFNGQNNFAVYDACFGSS
jgi:RHS repeat-associated protein